MKSIALAAGDPSRLVPSPSSRIHRQTGKHAYKVRFNDGAVPIAPAAVPNVLAAVLVFEDDVQSSQ
jgi:hypothetical protein